MDERLEQLVTNAKLHVPQTEAWQLTLTQLVDEILRSRKVCRSFRGQPLFGVYQEIYEQVRQQLLQDIEEKLNQCNLRQMPVRMWSKTLRNQTFREILDDAQIKKLAIEAQRYSPHTELRQYALGELVEAIRLSGKLCRPHRASFSPQFYELIYEEAVNTTLIYVCKKIDNYDPERGDKKFITWVNYRLDKEILNRRILESRHNYRELKMGDIHSLSELEKVVYSEATLSLFETIRECLEEDAENIFKQAHIRRRPDANFATIALARLSGKSWEEISTEFGIPLPTLSSFFQRCCEKFRSKLSQ